MSPWWDKVKEGTRRRAVVLQVDIGGHSSWLISEYRRNYFQPCQARSALAASLSLELSRLGYDLVFWAGDGGAFAAKMSADGHPQRLCEAADIAFAAFRNWRARKPLEFRVTASTMELTIGPNTGTWCAPEFNEFLKYERNIAVPNAFVITDALRAALVEETELRRFPKAYPVQLPNGHTIHCYVDRTHRPKRQVSPNSFGEWLIRKAEVRTLPGAQALSRDILRIGQCTLLDAADHETGYGQIVPDEGELQYLPAEQSIDDPHKARWKRARGRLIKQKVAGTSMQVVKFARELSDDPYGRLQYRTVDYADARAFHALLEKDPSLVLHYRENAMNVMGNGTSVLNILLTAIVVVIGDTPQLVLANRKARFGGFHGNCWAVSIGEQYMPVNGLRGKRHVSKDKSVEASVVRGLREELLGENFQGDIRVSIHAFCLEDYLDNFMFVAIADLRPLTFAHLLKLWYRAEDRGEHNAIAAIPATNDHLSACLASPGVPTGLWDAAQVNGLVGFARGVSRLSAESHTWQPNSHIRLAAAWWYMESLAGGG